MPPSFATIAVVFSLAAISSRTHHEHHVAVDAFAPPSPATSTSLSSMGMRAAHTAAMQQRTSLFLSKGGDNSGVGGGGTANRNQKKKRRFLQQAHPNPIINAPQPSKSPRQPVVSNGQSSSAETVNKSSSSNKQQRRGPPLRTNKSIEELEAILEKRWGTAGATSKPSKEKFDDDGDDYPQSPKSKNDLRGAAVFRSNARNRVLDPWAKEDGVYDDNKNNNVRSDSDIPERPQKVNKKKKAGYDRQEAMLNRVRSNQERLSSQRSNKPKQPQQAGDQKNKDYYNVPIDVSRDYYDEDDEGYEDGQRNSLISPRPVGGKGKSGPASSLSGGIFSDRSSASLGTRGKNILKGERRSDRAVREEMEKKQRPKRKKAPRSEPRLDDEGKEMFLTLEQADKIVQGILSHKKDGRALDSDSETIGDDEDEDINQWEDVGITDPTLLSNLQSTIMNCPYPLPVQDKACPSLVSGNDVLISTHTGSGKTLAFLAPIAQRLLIDSSGGGGNNSQQFPKAIVVAPGRELASQIVSVAQELFKDTGLTVSMAIGGTPYSRNVEKLRKRKPDVVVGTPGRIAELIIGRPGDKGGKMKTSALQTVVLDEFDALLQYDAHKEPTLAIMQAIERQHGERSGLQKVLCSATATDMMMASDEEKRAESNLIEDYLRPGYAHASVDDDDLLVTSGVKPKGGAKTTSARVSKTTIHGALHVPHRRLALEAVRKILNTDPVPQQALIFVDSPRRVDIVIEKLAKMDIIAAPLHGGASTSKSDRAQVNKALRDGYVGIVVATEMAARGIDAPYLTHVINLDLPTDASHYAHRAGRCGRGGRPGVAVSITCDVREKGVPGRFAEELGIEMYTVEARESKLRIVEG